MNSDFKYLTHNSNDENWGFYLTVAGSADVEPGTHYPPEGHPSGYQFKWDKGRILQEYQINYITRGEGIMETHDGIYEIKEGSLIIIRPNLWHRYRPLKEKGWVEHYVGFSGDLSKRMVSSSDLLSDKPVVQIGYNEAILNLFQDILNHIKAEKPGYHQVCSGLVIYILGQIIAIKRNENFNHSKIETAIQKACLIIRDNPSQNINVQKLAAEVDLNYSVFRKAFKKYTGLSPIQYHTSLRLKEAIYMLTNTDLCTKEISFKLGFCSVFYFSKLFKEKTNMTPARYRKINSAI
jgi:AraC-like DNA-binding protein